MTDDASSLASYILLLRMQMLTELALTYTCPWTLVRREMHYPSTPPLASALPLAVDASMGVPRNEQSSTIGFDT